ncbi:MAG: hypothetical protein AB2A00_35825 [Myxococcota bacterium]
MTTTTISRSSVPHRTTNTEGPQNTHGTGEATPVASPTSPPAHTPQDSFGTAPLGAPVTVRNGGLPDVVLSTPNATVHHGTDPGDFYCEHMFFTTQQEASKRGSSVATNAHGEKLVGFLHIPRDEHTSVDGSAYTQAERHQGTREVVGAAIRGYYLDASAKDRSGPVRLMLNGYATFMDVRNNPTGDFVSHRENIDAAMKQAFGKDLVTSEGAPYTNKQLKQNPDAQVWQYMVRDPQTHKVRSVLVHTQRFDVADPTINGQKGKSVQSSMDAFKPHAVLSMGVASGQYLAEFHADNGSLRLGEGRDRAHDDAVSATVSMPDNYSLARAIHRGSQANTPAIPVATLLTGGFRNG